MQSGMKMPSKQLQIPNDKTGGLIGRGGSVIKWLRNASMCDINIQNNRDVPPGSTVRIVTLTGAIANRSCRTADYAKIVGGEFKPDSSAPPGLIHKPRR